MALGAKLQRLGLSDPSGKKGLITVGPKGKRSARRLRLWNAGRKNK